MRRAPPPGPASASEATATMALEERPAEGCRRSVHSAARGARPNRSFSRRARKDGRPALATSPARKRPTSAGRGQARRRQAARVAAVILPAGSGARRGAGARVRSARYRRAAPATAGLGGGVSRGGAPWAGASRILRQGRLDRAFGGSFFRVQAASIAAPRKNAVTANPLAAHASAG